MSDTLAAFITAHGFGHAARAAAVMSAAQEQRPGLRFEIFTRTPRWFFAESLPGAFGWHPLSADVGLVQTSVLTEDLPETLRRLGRFLPIPINRLHRLAQRLKTLNCRAALCDVSPLGIAAAKAAGIPSILIENFTWDWIYEPYVQDHPRFREFIDLLRRVYVCAGIHIQTEPVCLPCPTTDLTATPASRRPRTLREVVRQRLGVAPGARMVLVTMGGIRGDFPFLDSLSQREDIHLVIPGGSDEIDLRPRLSLLPHHSNFYHPDLVAAADAVVGKAGYSTIAEVYAAGIPFAWLARPGFRESQVLTAYLRREVNGFEITPEEFASGTWAARLPELLALPERERAVPNSASEIASFILKRVRLQ